MKVINVRNVQAALPAGLEYLDHEGIKRDSRNGPVVVAPGPVTTVYQKPRERVIFWEQRDANPFFHLFESLWMLAGRNDVGFLLNFVKRMKGYSDDGKTLHGAYGYRWFHHFALVNDPGMEQEIKIQEINQLLSIINMLKRNPDDRRCVLQMWDPSVDLGNGGRDVPCNTQAYFSISVDGKLDMTVCCRSNDIIWGAYGANAVHFSILQEFIASGVGVPVGAYWQMSNNYHAYLDTLETVKGLINVPLGDLVAANYYAHTNRDFEPFPLMQTPVEQWLQDLHMFLEEGVVIGLRDPFFRRVATPMFMAHRAFKENVGAERYTKALEILERCEAKDWRVAAEQWITRRMVKFERSQDDGPDYC
jgi:thymidylate synthase